MKDQLNWGILGTGMIADKFASHLPQSNTGKLVAVGSRSQQSATVFAAKHGGCGHQGYEALIADPDVHVVYNCLPNGLHHEWSIKAMRAGKHVLCEKPFALNRGEAEQMFAVAEETGKVLVEAFMYRAHARTQELIKRVHSGEIGELRLMRSNFTFYREPSMDDARYHPSQGGGAIMDVGTYCVNFMRQLAGAEPTEMHALAHLYQDGGVDDYVAGTLRFGEDLLATFTCGMTVESDEGTYIAGTKGTIKVNAFWFCEEGFMITKDGVEEWVEVEEKRPLYAVEADSFAATVLQGEAAWVSKEDTLGNMRVMDALRASAGVPVE
ncbi:MAG: Gfo/Idh/MocA family oxidoreductase [Verrucomicrobiales bacterium]|nr:Gfo/Idh/MocA family oxidoreductase [Verrucomicrobiales bacterium]